MRSLIIVKSTLSAIKCIVYTYFFSNDCGKVDFRAKIAVYGVSFVCEKLAFANSCVWMGIGGKSLGGFPGCYKSKKPFGFLPCGRQEVQRYSIRLIRALSLLSIAFLPHQRHSQRSLMSCWTPSMPRLWRPKIGQIPLPLGLLFCLDTKK